MESDGYVIILYVLLISWGACLYVCQIYHIRYFIFAVFMSFIPQ
jgi:hypothetical protein